jgi:hypothetical protein
MTQGVTATKAQLNVYSFEQDNGMTRIMGPQQGLSEMHSRENTHALFDILLCSNSFLLCLAIAFP